MNPIENYINHLNPNQQAIAYQLRQLILESSPYIQEKFSYKVPFYYQHAWLCYLNADKDGLYLSFCRGQALSNTQGLLSAQGRKLVSLIHFKSPQDIPKETLREILQEALLLDELKWEEKKAKKS